MKRIILAALLTPLCGAFFCAPAFAQKTKAQLITEVATTFPDNVVGAITPSGVRTFQNDVINSIMPTAPVTAGNLACFSGTTGLLQDCGYAPNSLVVGTSTIFSGTSNGILFNSSGVLGNTNALAGAVLGTSSSSVPSLTQSPTLGVIGSAVGSLSFANTTSGTVTIQPATGALGSAIATLPAGTYNLLGDSVAQTITGAKSFNDATLILNGSSSGSTTLKAQAAASGTVSIPSATDTLVGKATTDTLTNKSISGASNTLSSIGNSSLSNMNAYTLKGNSTGSAAAPTDISIPALTQKASPISADMILLADSASSNALKMATVGSIASAGSVASLNGQTGAVVSYFQPQSRITLATGTPVMTSTVSGATTVYVTPYAGNMVPIYDGTNIVPTAFAEVSQATTDATKSPAAVAASSLYDIFCWVDTGPTNRCTRGPAWTNSTTRSAGTALVRVNGILLNNASITNGPAASRGTYVGTIASNSGSTIDYILCGATTAGVLNVFNAYNRVQTVCSTVNATAGYTYSSATVRQANGSAVNQVTFLAGLSEDAVTASYSSQISTAATGGAFGGIGLGYDATNSYSITRGICNTPSAASLICSPLVVMQQLPTIGSHFFAAVESGDGSTTTSFNGQGNAQLSVTVRN